MIEKLVKDVLSVISSKVDGFYLLPESICDDLVYKFNEIESEITIELYIDSNNDIDTFFLDGAYVSDEDVLEVSVTMSSSLSEKDKEELYYELIELITHEIQHIKQYESGVILPLKQPRRPLKYYTQPHEIDAQIAGFKKRAKLESKPIDEVVRHWFIKYEKIHRLSPKNVDIVMGKLLESV